MEVQLRRGLTLVELLVIILIVGVLSAVLTVVALRARERAKVSACASNLANIGKALQLYLADNHDEIPPYSTHAGTSMAGFYVPERVMDLVNALAGYGVGERGWKCPMDGNLPSGFTHDAAPYPGRISYESLAYLAWVDHESGKVNVNKLNERRNYPYLHDIVRLSLRTSSELASTAHGEFANHLYLDGSVKYRHLTKGREP